MVSKSSNANHKLLIFFHIAKTAGTTLHSILTRNFQDNEIISLNYGLNPECLTEFKNLSEDKKFKTRYLHAHMTPFGIHKYLPSSNYDYVVLLRDPIDRVISEYFYICREKDHPLHQTFIDKNITLLDYVTSDISLAAVQNGQTRILSGIKGVDWATGCGPVSHDTLDKAKENLQDHFTLVGLTEQFDEFLILLKRKLGWKTHHLLYQKKNVTSNRPHKQGVPRQVLRLIEQNNELDIELYEFAKQRFNDLIATQDIFFKKELKVFQTWNRAYNQTLKIRASLRPVKRLLISIQEKL